MKELYRITLKKWSNELVASGYPARWNRKSEFVLYTAESSCLACLENVVHRSGEGLHQDFALMSISIPKDIGISEIHPDALPGRWKSFDNYFACQEIGGVWYRERRTAILKVPSVIIPNAYNYLINTSHADFHEIKMKKVEPFLFDERIKD